MSSKRSFVSVLDQIGHDFKVIFEKVVPVAKVAEPFVAILDPALSPLFNTVVGVVSEVEQKFAALGQQSGSGPQKLAEALQIVSPAAQALLQVAGRQHDSGTVEKYVNGVVQLLNAIPAAQ